MRGAFPGVLLWERKFKLRNVLSAAAAGAIAVAVTVVYSHLLTPALESPLTFGAKWSGTYPLRLGAMVNPRNLAVLGTTIGPVLLASSAAVLVYSTVHWKEHGRRVGLVLLWGALPVLFWALRHGNSARHMMAAYSPLLLILAATLFSVVRARRAAAVLALLLVANYLSVPRSSSTAIPSTRLLGATADIQGQVSKAHGRAREFAGIRAKRKLWWGYFHNYPYALFEVLAGAERAASPEPRGTGPGRVVELTTRSGQSCRVEMVGGRTETARARVRDRQAEGWVVWSPDFGPAGAPSPRDRPGASAVRPGGRH